MGGNKRKIDFLFCIFRLTEKLGGFYLERFILLGKVIKIKRVHKKACTICISLLFGKKKPPAMLGAKKRFTDASDIKTSLC